MNYDITFSADKSLSKTAEQIRSSFLSMFAQSHVDKSGGMCHCVSLCLYIARPNVH